MDSREACDYWKKAGVIFVHVPKNAGTSISTALYGRTFWHTPASAIKKYVRSEFESCFKFGVVRDPVQRYLSAVSYIQKNYDLLDGGPLIPHKNLLGDPVRLFDQWLMNVDISKVNFVFRPQSYYLCSKEGEILVDSLLEFEHLSQGIATLLNKVPQLKNLPHLNQSKSWGGAHPHILSWKSD